MVSPFDPDIMACCECVFYLCLAIFILNVFMVVKFEDKLIPVFFMLFGTMQYLQLFAYTEEIFFTGSLGVLFIGLSVYINAKGVELL